MEEWKFFAPRRAKLMVFIVFLLVFVVRWSENINTLEMDCHGNQCTVSGELKRHVGFPFQTYKIVVNTDTHYNYFYDFNFFANFGFWYLAACFTDWVLNATGIKDAVRRKLIAMLKG